MVLCRPRCAPAPLRLRACELPPPPPFAPLIMQRQAFVSVGTHGALKAVGAVEAATAAGGEAGEASLQFCNTYHLLCHPVKTRNSLRVSEFPGKLLNSSRLMAYWECMQGPVVVEAAGGLHGFTRRQARDIFITNVWSTRSFWA